VVALRGGAVESEHRVAWCVVDGDGSVAGPDPDLPVFARSAVKPLQALGSVRAGVLERFRLGERHLALACASHGGSPAHVAVVSEVLNACGMLEDALACGPELPRDPRAAADARPSRIRHNCSGKHAFGIARCLAEGWPLDGYFRAGHPLQGAMRESVAEACGVTEASVEATDGCGMRTFAVPLAGLARAFGRLAGGGLGPAGDRCAAAMRAYPELVAYDGAIDTELMRAEDGLVAKIGAEGVLAVGLADGRGLALKVRDGSLRAVPPAGVALVRFELGLAAAVPEALVAAPILNSRGVRVGELRAARAPVRP
jgi:L-asparaginase II